MLEPPALEPSGPVTIVATATYLTATMAATVASLIVVADLPPPDLLDTVVTATFRSGCGAVAFLGACCPNSGGPPTTDPSPRISLVLLSGGAISSVAASVLLDGDREPALEAEPDGAIFPFPLLEPKAMSALLRPPATSAPGICTPRD
jgi:hypothetical protein